MSTPIQPWTFLVVAVATFDDSVTPSCCEVNGRDLAAESRVHGQRPAVMGRVVGDGSEDSGTRLPAQYLTRR